MAIDALKKAFATTKKHFWVLLAMLVPAALISGLVEYVVEILSNHYEMAQVANIGNLFYEIGLGGDGFGILLLEIAAFIISSVIGASCLMGYLESDEHDDFRFENAFAAFRTGRTWLVAALYAVFLGLIQFIFCLVFATLTVICTLGFSGSIDSVSSSPSEKAAIIIVSLVVGILLAILYIFVITGLEYAYLTYFEAKRDGKQVPIMQGFNESWKLMKGNRWNFIWLKVLFVLIFLVVGVVLGLVAWLFWWLFTAVLTWTLLAVLLEVIVGAVAIVFVVVYSVWYFMADIKFYEAINK